MSVFLKTHPKPNHRHDKMDNSNALTNEARLLVTRVEELIPHCDCYFCIFVSLLLQWQPALRVRALVLWLPPARSSELLSLLQINK